MTDGPIPPPVVDLDDSAVRSYLKDEGWHQADLDCVIPECDRDHCDEECTCSTEEASPRLGVRTDNDEVGLAKAFEQLHKLAHPDQSGHVALCKSEPCRSLPWAVVNEIAKVA